MAKIKHNNFLDTVDEVISNAKRAGVLHLNAEGEFLNGRKIKIKGKELFHFGTTGYLGLEQDERLKKAAIDAIKKYGTQFPLSKTYISHPLYSELEEKIKSMYDHPIIITKNSTLGHMAVVPTAVNDEDGVILDHQVHWSVQNAAQLLKTRGIPVGMIRHNKLEMLEDKIKELSSKCRKIWYMADGVYSMFGDYAPVQELIELSNKFPQLHLYFDDVHGMSWKGKNGTGHVMHILKELPENALLFGTLSKTFGASGAVVVCPDRKLYQKIKNFGGPLTFSAQLEPASVAAASASADIHLSREIYELQEELHDKINYFNALLQHTDLPLIERNESPVFFIGTGIPNTGYKFVQRLMNDGYFVNLGLYPAVPVKNTGVRITISRHNKKEEIKFLVEAMEYHFPRALEETNSDLIRVRRAFKLPVVEKKEKAIIHQLLTIQHESTIRDIDKKEWNQMLGRQSTFDWEGQDFLEKVFRNHELREHNWSFHYFIIRDELNKPVLATFFSHALWKDDMLAPASVSVEVEKRRNSENPYYLTSKVLAMGSLFTEGQHFYLDKAHPECIAAVNLLLKTVEELNYRIQAQMLVLRDFGKKNSLDHIFHNEGYIKIDMPEACIMENLSWESEPGYLATLSPRSRKHFKKEVKPYEDKFEVLHKGTASPEEIAIYYELYKNVKGNNFGLNTFTYPKELFADMSENPNWEFLVLYLKKQFDTRNKRVPVGVMFCYKNLSHTYVPSLIGMDYDYSKEYQIYRQLLFQTIKRAKSLGFMKIDFGMSASFEKRKLGAKIISKSAYVQAQDNFAMEILGIMRNEV